MEPLPGPPNEDLGPMRVWLTEVDVPGLAMSRSVGDKVAKTVGVTAVPEIQKHRIGPDVSHLTNCTMIVCIFLALCVTFL